jgi:competence protein ComEC
MSISDVWLRSPLLRLVLPLLTGIYAAETTWLLVFCSVALFSYLCFFLMGIGVNRHWMSLRYAFHTGIFYSFVWMLLGMCMVRSTNRKHDVWHVAHRTGNEAVYAIRLLDEPTEAKGRWKVTGEIMGAHCDSAFTGCRGKVALTIERDTTSAELLHVDDVLVVKCTPNVLDAPRNPLEFNYAEYMRTQDVWAQANVRQTDWSLCDSLLAATLLSATLRGTFIRWRETLLQRLAQEPIEQREMGVLSALILGKASAIDREVIQNYARAGVVHVLAVSGMHVALIYMLLKPLFERLWGRSKARRLKTIIPVVLLWLYAAMTGFSPSVLRAAWMFSFVIVADNFGLRNTIYNAMAASALLLLMMDPMIAFSMGFMLSYLAVIGIAAIHPALHRLFYFESRISKWLWELASISVSAQLATLPLTLYLFHQFPTWFIITNVMVIPLSTIVLYLALAYFALLAIAPFASFIAGLVGLLTRIMNDLMEWSAHWPAALIEGVYWEPWEAWLCVAIIVAWCVSVLERNKHALLIALGIQVCWLSGGFIARLEKNEHDEICIHSDYRGEAITVISQGRMFTIDDDLASKRAFSNYRMSWYARSCDTLSWEDKIQSEILTLNAPQIQLSDCNLLLADSTLLYHSAIDTSATIFFSDRGKPHYWKREELALVAGHTVILGNRLSRKRREWLKQQLSATCRVLDLKDGAVLWREGEWRQFSSRR